MFCKNRDRLIDGDIARKFFAATLNHAQVRTLLAGVDHLADELTGVRNARAGPEHPSPESLRSAAVQCMRRAGSDERAVRGAIAVVIAGEWVQNLARMEAGLEQPVEAAVAAARMRWWR